MNTYYSDPDDQSAFVRLVRSGLSIEEAIDQLRLMGIEPTNRVVIHYGVALVRPTLSVAIDIMERNERKKSRFPYFYGKRRY